MSDSQEMGERMPVPKAPALVYVGTDGCCTVLDLADLTQMDERERVLCAALLEYALTRVQAATTRHLAAAD
ncbi:hypothetical protein ACFQ07_14170, partial [Actinomadura adrarensis]